MRQQSLSWEFGICDSKFRAGNMWTSALTSINLNAAEGVMKVRPWVELDLSPVIPVKAGFLAMGFRRLVGWRSIYLYPPPRWDLIRANSRMAISPSTGGSSLTSATVNKWSTPRRGWILLRLDVLIQILSGFSCLIASPHFIELGPVECHVLGITGRRYLPVVRNTLDERSCRDEPLNGGRHVDGRPPNVIFVTPRFSLPTKRFDDM